MNEWKEGMKRRKKRMKEGRKKRHENVSDYLGRGRNNGRGKRR